MRFSYAIALVLTISIGATYWYRSTEYICPIPVTYSLGSIDASFSITNAESKEAIEQATALWEDATDLDLFTPVLGDGDITVSFVFDERQAEANAQASDEAGLDEVAEANQTIRDNISNLRDSYTVMEQSFTARKASYDSRLGAYDIAVRQANDRGGAGAEQFAVLQQDKQELEVELNTLREQSAELQRVATQLNQLIAESDNLVTTYNSQVRQYNSRYGEGEEFTQGDYTGDAINIYKFSNQNELVSVLAHEFGHALGIKHIEESDALMHYLLEEGDDTEPMLTPADIEAVTDVCQVDTWQFKARQIIRSIF